MVPSIQKEEKAIAQKRLSIEAKDKLEAIVPAVTQDDSLDREKSMLPRFSSV